jgi:glycosyltransferase involved in cell wall biosynthesis
MLLFAVTFASLAMMWRFVRFYCADQLQWREATAYRPRVAVILSLRGADPSLENCLAALLAQSYQRYLVFIVIDNAADPARAVVEHVLAGARSTVDVKIDFLRDPGETRSLKVSALLQAIAQLPDDVEVIALLDSDAIPATDWLNRLVAPMADAKVATVTGLRWCLPLDQSWGSLIRYSYNAISCMAAYSLDVLWAGSLAFRRRDLERSNMQARWARSLSDDVSAGGPVRMIGQRGVFINSGILPNTESASFKGAYSQIVRHMVCARLELSKWPVIVGLAFANFAAVVLAVGLLVSTTTPWPWKCAIAILLLLYWGGMHASVVAVDRTVAAGTRTSRSRLLNIRHMLALALVLFLTARAAVAAMFARSIEWRGIRYVVDRRDGVRMLAYRPFTGSVGAANTRSIL